MYLIDTNVLSELRRPRPHGAVVSWFESVPDHKLFLSSVTIGEIQKGIENTRDRDQQKAIEIERWLDRIVRAYRIIDMDAVVFREWARLMHRRADVLKEDAMIAAVARIHRLTVVTRNIRDFDGFSVELLNPFTFRDG